jgi:hypothetical protein
MACVGNFAFASATQGWFVARNKIWELPLLLAVTLSLMRPDLIASLMGIPTNSATGPISSGWLSYGLIYLMQRPRDIPGKRSAWFFRSAIPSMNC